MIAAASPLGRLRWIGSPPVVGDPEADLAIGPHGLAIVEGGVRRAG